MKIRIFAIIVLITFLAACASIPAEHKGATTGAAVGATTGAVAGALLGSKGAKTETAIIGGLVGALVGGAIGHYTYDVKRSQQETAQRYDYQSSMGTMIRIEKTSVLPDNVLPGGKVDLKATYALLGTSTGESISVTEIREIRHNGELLGKPEVNVTRSGGTYTSTVPLILPDNAKKGVYTVATTIQTPSAKDTAETTFNVK